MRCDECNTDFSLIEGFCKSGAVCPEGQFYGPQYDALSGQLYSCRECPSKCTTCNYMISTQTFVCTTCDTQTSEVVDGKCVPKSCADGTALTFDTFFGYVCESCPSSCATCFQDAGRFYCPTCKEFNVKSSTDNM